MTLALRIQDQLQNSLESLRGSLALLEEPIEQAAQTLTDAIMRGGRVFTLGQGSGALAARHLATILTDRLEHERPGLPVYSLHPDSASMHDAADLDDGLARQVAALVQPGDALVAFSTLGASAAVERALVAAGQHDCAIVAIAGGDGGRVANHIGERDVLICVPGGAAARITELQFIVIHCLCDGIDYVLLGA